MGSIVKFPWGYGNPSTTTYPSWCPDFVELTQPICPDITHSHFSGEWPCPHRSSNPSAGYPESLPYPGFNLVLLLEGWRMGFWVFFSQTQCSQNLTAYPLILLLFPLWWKRWSEWHLLTLPCLLPDLFSMSWVISISSCLLLKRKKQAHGGLTSAGPSHQTGASCLT